MANQKVTIRSAHERGKILEAEVFVDDEGLQLQIPLSRLDGLTSEEQKVLIAEEAIRVMPPKKTRSDLTGEVKKNA
ncbi:MAG: hypothetical protein PHV74_00080 [Dehalococcoidia bacterium]|nr:hypothetical protein [Dehalococcoidia bacterium]